MESGELAAEATAAEVVARRALVRSGPSLDMAVSIWYFLPAAWMPRGSLQHPAGPQQLAGRCSLIEVNEEQQVFPSPQGTPSASDPGRWAAGEGSEA